MMGASLASPSLATLNRLKSTTSRANRISIETYQCLQRYAGSLPRLAPEDDKRFAQAEVRRAWLFASISREVAGLTVRIADELLLLCNITVTSGIVRDNARQKLAKALDESPPLPGMPIDLRQQRLRRLPVNEALSLIMDNLDLMCGQVDALMQALATGEFVESGVDDSARTQSDQA